jgi:G:T/U-mismatch repair DNA glycosylase
VHLNPDRKNKSRSTSLSYICNAKFKKLTELLVGSKLGTEEKRQRPVEKSKQQAKQAKQNAKDEGIEDMDRMESMALLERSRGEYMVRANMGWR